MMSTKDSIALSVLKSYAIKLYGYRQLPYALVKRILKLDKNSDLKYVEFLKDLCADFMRVKGYYKDKEKENLANKQIVQLCLEFFADNKEVKDI